ncbi:MAG: TlpA disulfide reductase family protein [Nitrospinota bacterium]|nr:TlpA disulfide reductase family protein [Nitrospinota bacterium]
MDKRSTMLCPKNKIIVFSSVFFILMLTGIFLLSSQRNLFAVSLEEKRPVNKIKKDARNQLPHEVAPMEGFIAPEFTFPNINGKSVSLSQFRGKVVFLNIWATWCGPCRVEMPGMEKLWRKFKNEDFVMLAVSIDRLGEPVVTPFIQELGLTFPALLDPESTIQSLYMVRALPSSLIIDKNGRIVTRVAGGREWYTPEIIDIFEKLIHS